MRNSDMTLTSSKFCSALKRYWPMGPPKVEDMHGFSMVLQPSKKQAKGSAAVREQFRVLPAVSNQALATFLGLHFDPQNGTSCQHCSMGYDMHAAVRDLPQDILKVRHRKDSAI